MALSTRGGVRSVQRTSKNLQKETRKASIPHDQANPAVFRHAAGGVVSCCRREPIICRTDPGGHGTPVDSRHARAGRRGRLRLGLDRAGRRGRGRHHRRRALPALTATPTTTASRAPAGAAATPSSPAAVSRAAAGTTAAATARSRTGARAARGRRARARTATGRAAAGPARRGPAATASAATALAGTFAPAPASAATEGRPSGGAGTARVQGTGPQTADEQHIGGDAHAAAHGARGPRRRHPSPPFPLADGDPCRNGLS